MGAIVGGYLLGVYTGTYEIKPYGKLKGTIERVHKKLNGGKDANSGAPPVIETIFTDVLVEKHPIELEQPMTGGGLSSFGDAVLLVTHDGKIYDVTGGQTQFLFKGPDNGLQGYKDVAAREEYSTVEHRFDRLRFNDILFFEDQDQRGIALSYVDWNVEGECFRTAVAKLMLRDNERSAEDLSGIDESRWEVVYQAQPCLKLKFTWRALEGHMSGGRMDHLGGQVIVLANGDYHLDGVYGPGPISQKRDNDYGKVVQIDLNSGESKHLSIGHRNTQGLLVDNGNVWVVEHGARGGDELNLIKEGKDYGWPSRTLGTNYDKLPWATSSELGRHTGYEAPIYAWLPSIGISNITRIENFHSAWDGDFLVTSMKGKRLFRVRIEKERVMFAEEMTIGERVRYGHQHSDGKIYLWTDAYEILILEPSKLPTVHDYLAQVKDTMGLDEAQATKLSNTVFACAECHSLTSTTSEGAPALRGVFGKPIANSSYPYYSAALKSKNGNWDAANLGEYIADPQGFAQGTVMPPQNVTDQYVIDGIVELLKTLSSDGVEQTYNN